jgi:hypothetical protein
LKNNPCSKIGTLGTNGTNFVAQQNPTKPAKNPFAVSIDTVRHKKLQKSYKNRELIGGSAV